MTSRDAGFALVKRLGVSALLVLVIVASAGILPTLTAPQAEDEPLDVPEYDPESLAATPIPAAGDVEVNATGGDRDGVVVIDAAHSNRFDRTDIEPLVDALAALGYGVRFHDGDQNLHNALSGASAFVVIDPAEEFERNEVITVRTFTSQGGHLLMLGEPTRTGISAGSSTTSLTAQESALTTLASRYDMSLGTAYLYDLETNGGNYKHVVAEPSPESAVDADRVVLFTAAAVHARSGTVLLQTVETTREAGLDGSRSYPVAIHRERHNVVLVGDSSVLRADRATIGDNEQFVASLVDFLVSGTPRDDDPDEVNATAPVSDREERSKAVIHSGSKELTHSVGEASRPLAGTAGTPGPDATSVTRYFLDLGSELTAANSVAFGLVSAVRQHRKRHIQVQTNG